MNPKSRPSPPVPIPSRRPRSAAARHQPPPPPSRGSFRRPVMKLDRVPENDDWVEEAYYYDVYMSEDDMERLLAKVRSHLAVALPGDRLHRVGRLHSSKSGKVGRCSTLATSASSRSPPSASETWFIRNQQSQDGEQTRLVLCSLYLLFGIAMNVHELQSGSGAHSSTVFQDVGKANLGNSQG